MTRAAIYARVAMADPTRLADQEARCRRHAAARGWEVVGVWRDVGGGWRGRRPGLASLRAAIEGGAVDTVIATQAARLSRDPAAVARLIAEAGEAGASIVTVDGDPASDGVWCALADERRPGWRGAVGGVALVRSKPPWRRR